MEVIVAAVGSPRHRGLRAAIFDFENRAGRYFSLRVVEVRQVRAAKSDPDAARRREGEALLARVPSELETVALTRRGRTFTSRGLADYLGGLATYGLPGAAFLIGGADGLDEEMLERASHRLSLSPMTLPHELARLVLAEQLYRAGTILRGEPYHRGSEAG